MPAFNVAEYLPRCIESLTTQTEKAIQIIIINDGSTDGTLKIANDYAQKDSRILVIDQANHGLSHARNNGLLSATGKFIFFVDSDDWVEPQMIEDMIGRCTSTNSDVAVAGITLDYYTKDEKLIHSDVRKQDEWIYDTVTPLPDGALTEEFINLLGFSTNKAYRRDFLNALKENFPEDITLYEDVDFNVRILSKAQRIAFMAQSFYHYGQRPRLTLISVRDENFLTLSFRAISGFDSLLEEWGVDKEVRSTRMANASASALWVALNGAVTKSQPRDFLNKLLKSDGADQLVSKALTARSKNWRYRWAAFSIGHGLHRAGLASVAIVLPIRKYKAHLLRFIRR